MAVSSPTRPAVARDGRHRSLWLQQALGDAPDAPPLTGATTADVVIAGGGFVGLWTALRLKELDPACDVVVLERDVCGGGASGRNGGMALSWWPKLSSLIRICGPEEALRLARASEAAVGELGAFCEAHGIDAEVTPGGMLWTATAPAHVGAWEAVMRQCASVGAEPFVRLSAAEVAARTGSSLHLAGVLEPAAVTVQPAKLARGLRRVALERGVRIHERTAVTGFTRERPLRVTTDHGHVDAQRLVIATNAWAQAIPELRRSFVTVTSDIVATAPIPDRLAELGWTGGESVTDSQMMVNYYRTTRDGRLVFGKGTAGLRLGTTVGDRLDRNPAHTALVTAELHRTYPQLAGVPIARDWGGPIDRTPTSIPRIGRLDGRDHLLVGVGWSGNGVGPSLLGGQILARLALGIRDQWTTSPLVDHRHDRFPPDPVRYVSGRLVRQAVVRKERAEAAGRRPRGLDVRLARLAPAGLEDKH
ncbi:NAD(P)/FAD-dependent oxidoreductase [Patulibacter defluvii]|uniref:NAD(P)/FAD-dependent oxidoreductase n=1 Tax=Patulibacter defluvii TaxID=3095358 RepID=UPI002A74A40F|nr:FAD-binding oxidoreductase [Patulibacter sp. DM4]